MANVRTDEQYQSLIEANLVKALSIRERSDLLFPIYQTKQDQLEDYLVKWQSRKSLCKSQHFEEFLTITNIPRAKFNCGIKSLTRSDQKVLWEGLQQKNWFKINKKIFSLIDSKLETEPNDFSYSVRFHLRYVKELLNKQVGGSFTLTKDSLNQVLKYIEKDLLDISLKTLVFDLHEQKKNIAFKGSSSKARFRSYLLERFSEEAISLFYADYPVLYRLLAERVQFHLDNFAFFLDSLKKSLQKIGLLFKLVAPYHVVIDSLNNSDSHNKGKTVIVFKLNEQKLLFKFKDLHIAEKWDEFLSIVERKTGSQFYKVKKVVGNEFTIEEFVEHRPCMSEDELTNFYYRFGEYIALCYFLCGNDIHSENLVACGSFPVIVDIETLFQSGNPKQETHDTDTKFSVKKSQSILATSMLPVPSFENRIEPRVVSEDSEQGVNISALNGGRQLLPFKVLKLVSENTDNVHFVYQEHYTKEQQNIPTFHSEAVDPLRYRAQIIKGFKSQYQFFLRNKAYLIRKLAEVFSDCRVRSILKSTQQYYDMLDYSRHFSCMEDYLEREKLFENQWAFPYKNKAVVPYEVADLLQHDIPIFFTDVATKHVITSTGVVIKDYYVQTALERVKKRIQALSDADLAFQLVLLKNSLGCLCKKNKYLLGNDADKQLQAISEQLRKRAIFDSQHEQVIFPDFVLKHDKQVYEAIPCNFYDGLAGIYVFLLYYTYFYPEKKLHEMVRVMRMQLDAECQLDLTSSSVYFGKLSMLTALYYCFKLSPNQADLQQALKLTKELSENIDRIADSADWLTGCSSTIKLLTALYKATKQVKFLEVAEQLAATIDLSTIELNGLSHGFSGVALAVNELQQLSDHDYAEMIHLCLMRERENFNGVLWQDLRKEVNFTAQWCHGCTGIGLVRLELLKANFADDQLQAELEKCVDHVLNIDLNDDCLCHGNSGNCIFLLEVYNSKQLDEKKNKQICQKLAEFEKKLVFEGANLEGMDTFPKLGLMTGLIGIGWYWLYKYHYPKISNVLLLN